MARNNRAVKHQEQEPEAATTETTTVELSRRVGDQAPAVDINTFNLDALMKEYKTKSNVIRYLTTQGQSRSQIAKFMNIRYQHVRNVLTQPLKAPTVVEVEVKTPAETS